MKRYLKPLAVFNAILLAALVVVFATGGFWGGTKSNPVFSFVGTPNARPTAPEAVGSPARTDGQQPVPSPDKKGD